MAEELAIEQVVVEFGVLGPQASALAAQMMLVNMKLNRMVFRLLGV